MRVALTRAAGGNDALAGSKNNAASFRSSSGKIPKSSPMTSDSPNAITSPVRFMARGLAEAPGDENPRHACGRDCDGNGGGGRNGGGGLRQAPADRPAIIQ